MSPGSLHQSSPAAAASPLLSVRLNSGGGTAEAAAGPASGPPLSGPRSPAAAFAGGIRPQGVVGVSSAAPVRFPVYLQEGGGLVGASSGGILCNLLSPNPDNRSQAARWVSSSVANP